MANVSTWSTTAASNNQATPDGFPEGQNPGSLNDCARTMMAGVRTWYESAQWIDYGQTPTKTSSNTFTVSGDQTAIYDVGRRLKFTGSASGYDTISASSYSAPNTTVTLTASPISGTLTAVAVGIISGTNSALPTGFDITGKWTIDSSGRLLNGGITQPFFVVNRASSTQTMTASAVTTVIFNNETSDTGSGFDSTTGIFTAPVTGLYDFNYNLRLQNNASGAAIVNDIYLSKNNGVSSGTNCPSLIGFTLGGSIGAAGNAFTVGGSFSIYLSASDTMRIKIDMGTVGGSGAFTVNLFSYFCGSFLR